MQNHPLRLASVEASGVTKPVRGVRFAQFEQSERGAPRSGASRPATARQSTNLRRVEESAASSSSVAHVQLVLAAGFTQHMARSKPKTGHQASVRKPPAQAMQMHHIHRGQPSQPNPSLKLSTNGKTPGPRYSVVHHLQRGPGVSPSVPA